MDPHLVLDAAALCLLLVLLHLLGKRHPESRVHLWLAGLLLILGEALAHILFTVPGPWHRASHAAALVFYLLAGQTFIYASLRPLDHDRRLFTALFLSATPQVAAMILYGFDVRGERPFLICAAAGVALALLCTPLASRPVLFCTLKLLGWTGFVGAVLQPDFRYAVYWVLFWVYMCAAVIFARSLPRISTGRYAIVLGFGVWSLCFLTHSWVSEHPAFQPYVDDIWNLQKFLVAIGMLMVMLEDQVARNRDLALHDDLTGLPNRRLFDDRISQAILQGARTGSKTGLFLLDLNGFKGINDSFGHQAGDEVLRAVTANLTRVLRSSDTLARIGGDEFAIIASNLRAPDTLMELIHSAISVPITVSGSEIVVTASVGLAISPEDTLSPENLSRLADARMYAEKQMA